MPSGRLRQILVRLHLLRLAKTLHWGVRQTWVRLQGLLKRLTRLPFFGTYIAVLVLYLDRNNILSFDFEELERVCAELDKGDLTYWIAGGWGVDALVGSETKRHGDLDIVLDSFDENITTVDQIVVRFGYKRQAPLGGTIWFPKDAVYEDGRGHRIEVLGIDWQRIEDAANANRSETDAKTSIGKKPSSPSVLARFTTTGRLGEKTLPVLSQDAQRILHTGYQRRREDVFADAILDLLEASRSHAAEHSSSVGTSRDATPGASSTLLLIPFFTFPAELWNLCTTLHNDLEAIPPHVTLAYPFLPVSEVNDEVIRQLTLLFAEETAFTFQLGEVKWFDKGVVYLEPSASERLRAMTERLQENFPDFHPYGGEFDSIVPHVTLSQHGSFADRRMLAKRATAFLPLNVPASHVWLMSNDNVGGAWSVLEIFSLGTTPHHD
jgi:2'-5' RNA ligase